MLSFDASVAFPHILLVVVFMVEVQIPSFAAAVVGVAETGGGVETLSARKSKIIWEIGRGWRRGRRRGAGGG